MRKKYFLVFILYGINYSFAQVIFNRNYQDSILISNAILQILDKGFVVVGFGVGSSGPGDDNFILKTNINGDLKWLRLNDFGHGAGDDLKEIIEVDDGNYIAGGASTDTSASTFGSQAILLKIDTSGNILWVKKYGIDTLSERFYAIRQTKDKGYIVAGWRYLNRNASTSNILLVKTDSMGNAQWEKTYGGPYYDFCRSMVSTNDGGYILAGQTESFGAGAYDMYMIKTDSVGNFKWQKTFGSGGNDIASKVINTSDGGLLLAGAYTFDLVNDICAGWLVKTDSAGNKQWDKKYYGTGKAEFTGVKELSDGNFVACGHTKRNSNGINYTGWLVKIKPDGDTIWTKTYQYYNDSADHYFYGMDLCKDGGFAMCGMNFNLHDTITTSWVQQVWLVKTDCEGNADKWDSVACTIGGVGISEEKINPNKTEVKIIPNPFINSATLRITNFAELIIKNIELKFVDVLGREVLNEKIISEETKIERESLPSGIYFYQLRNGKQIIARGKIVIE